MGKLVRWRSLLLQVIDMAIWAVSAAAAMLLADAFMLMRIQVFAVVLAVHIFVYQFMSMYQVIWRYAGVRQLIKCFACEALAYLLIDVGAAVFFHWQITRFCAVGLVCSSLLLVGSRIAYLCALTYKYGGLRPVAGEGIRTLIIGSGDAARVLLADMNRDKGQPYSPVGLLDDDPAKRGRSIWNVKVCGPIDELPRFYEQLDASCAIFAIFNISLERKREILELCADNGIKVLMSPSPHQLQEVSEGVTRHLRGVDIEDLLGREPVHLDRGPATEFIRGRRVLVTGGGGSIGGELCRQIAGMGPAELVLVDVYENGVYDVQQELLWKHAADLDLKVEILSVCDKLQLDRVFRTHRPEIVFHAAAHKHVPLMEDAPVEAIKNNVFGTLNAAESADRWGVERFVLISTDKAVNPTNMMGATKRCCELVVQAMGRRSKTEFVAVRFGNVLGSSGSVIPLFARQIAEGRPVTVTHPEVIRYFMTIQEAAQLVLTAGSTANGGEIFVLDMGEPVKILDLARNMIRLAGLEPERDVPIVFTGLRPGEKLFEELLLSEEGIQRTGHEKIFAAAPVLTMEAREFWRTLKKLEAAAYRDDREEAARQLSLLVPSYHRPPRQTLGAKPECGAAPTYETADRQLAMQA